MEYIHPILDAIQQHILKNMPEYVIGISALSIATVVTMPPLIPKSLQDWWNWIRNALQTAIPAARSAREKAEINKDKEEI